MITLEKAIILAAKWHKGQVDKQGKPYILHPLAVMMSLPPRLQIAGLLHDVLEDCAITFGELYDRVDDPLTMAILDRLTHRKGESREAYITRICDNPDAVRVKLKDIGHNMDRVYGLENPTRERMIVKYGRDLAQIAQRGYDLTTGEHL